MPGTNHRRRANPKKGAKPAPLKDLPGNILLRIFDLLERDSILTVVLVSRRFHDIALRSDALALSAGLDIQLENIDASTNAVIAFCARVGQIESSGRRLRVVISTTGNSANTAANSDALERFNILCASAFTTVVHSLRSTIFLSSRADPQFTGMLLRALCNQPAPLLKEFTCITAPYLITFQNLPATLFGGTAPLLRSIQIIGLALPTTYIYALVNVTVAYLEVFDLHALREICVNLPSLARLDLSFEASLLNAAMLDRADVFPNPQIRIKTLGVALFHQEYDKNDIDHLPRVFQRFAPNAALSITLGDASVCVVQLVSSFVDTYIQGGLRVVAQQKAGTFYALVTGVTDNTRTVAFRILLTLTTSANIIPSDSCCFTTLSGISGRISCIRLPCTLAKPFGFIKSQVAALTEVIVDLVDAPSDADRDTLEACPSTWTSEVAISFVHKLRNMDRRQSSKFPVVRQNEIYVPKLFTAEQCKKITMKLRTRVPRAISPLYAPVLAIGLGLMPSINIIQLELEPGLSFRLPA